MRRAKTIDSKLVETRSQQRAEPSDSSVSVSENANEAQHQARLDADDDNVQLSPTISEIVNCGDAGGQKRHNSASRAKSNSDVDGPSRHSSNLTQEDRIKHIKQKLQTAKKNVQGVASSPVNELDLTH